MKNKIVYNVLYAVLFAMATLVWGCDSYEDEASDANETRDQLTRLAQTWNGDRVLFEGVDVTQQDFVGFTLTFNEDGTWVAVNGDPTFGNQGVWDFETGNVNRILMNDVPVDLFFTIGASQLTLEFTLNGASIGRLKGVTGDYVIDLSPLQ